MGEGNENHQFTIGLLAALGHECSLVLDDQRRITIDPPIPWLASFPEDNARTRLNLLGGLFGLDSQAIESAANYLDSNGHLRILSDDLLLPNLTDSLRQVRWVDEMSVRLRMPDEDTAPEHVRYFCHAIAERIEKLVHRTDPIPGLFNGKLAEIFVEPSLRRLRPTRMNLMSGASERTGLREPLTLFLERMDRAALLFGDPGAGKTSLLRMIGWGILNGEHRRYCMPLSVELRSSEISNGDSDLVAIAVTQAIDVSDQDRNDLCTGLTRPLVLWSFEAPLQSSARTSDGACQAEGRLTNLTTAPL